MAGLSQAVDTNAELYADLLRKAQGDNTLAERWMTELTGGGGPTESGGVLQRLVSEPVPCKLTLFRSPSLTSTAPMLLILAPSITQRAVCRSAWPAPGACRGFGCRGEGGRGSCSILLPSADPTPLDLCPAPSCPALARATRVE